MASKPHKQPSTRTIAASQFKAQCLQIFDDIAHDHLSVIVTKRGVPVAQVIPIAARDVGPLRGMLKGKLVIQNNSDIVHFDCSDDWESNR